MTLENGELTSRQAHLPERYEQRHLADLAPGDVLETSAEALWADQEGRLWLASDYSIDPTKFDMLAAESTIIIIQTEKGFVVDLWNTPTSPAYITTITDEEFIKSDDMDIDQRVPVIALITTEKESKTFSKIYKLNYGGITHLDRLRASGKKTKKQKTSIKT